MSLEKELRDWVESTFKGLWEVQKAEKVPDPEDLRLNSNHAKDLEEATVLYADLNGSTAMVDRFKWEFSAEIYKTYLKCASDLIKAEGGVITAYDGDRVMAVFTGNQKNSNAARCALKINWAVKKIIQPSIKLKWDTDHIVDHIVGIDTSQLRTARVGVRGDNDLVWVGRAANYAAKLTSVAGPATRITEAVYQKLSERIKIADGGKNMWVRQYCEEVGMYTYTSTWMLKV